MKNFVIHRSNQQSETAHDHRAWANRRAAAQELQRCAGSQYAQGDQARGPDQALAQHTAAELELMQAMEAYKQSSGRLFPTWSEVLEVLRGLGYHKRTPGPPDGTGGAPFESQARPTGIDSIRGLERGSAPAAGGGA
jgi:hypothetical protein